MLLRASKFGSGHRGKSTVSAAQEVFGTGKVCYSRVPAVPDVPEPLRVAATCPCSVLQQLGDLLAGRQKGDRKPMSVSKDVEQRRQEIRATETAR